MNKDIDNIDNTDKSVEKALDIMESSSEINVEQLQEMLKNEETLQACRDIMDSSLFLQQKGHLCQRCIIADGEVFCLNHIGVALDTRRIPPVKCARIKASRLLNLHHVLDRHAF